jgi:pimeloyl-ACP methyl ester carboxylesterase
MPLAAINGASLYYEESGSGTPFLFSHGLGGDLTQVAGLVTGLPGMRVILFDNRSHGRSLTTRHPGNLHFDSLAEDAAALLSHLGIRRAVVGGVSMGAGVCLALAARNPEIPLALILSRPAWLDRPMPKNLAVFPLIADLVDQLGWKAALSAFEETKQYQHYLRETPATAESLRGLFGGRTETAIVSSFREIPASAPVGSLAKLREIRAPALVLGNRNDPIHPFEMAEALAAALPQARFEQIVSKSEDSIEHQRQFREAVQRFLSSLAGV